jgi:hypothetical protein
MRSTHRKWVLISSRGILGHILADVLHFRRSAFFGRLACDAFYNILFAFITLFDMLV